MSGFAKVSAAAPEGDLPGESATREAALWRVAPLVFAACTVAMILSLPLFPSHDGPVHLYYVEVVKGLLTHSGPYAQEFAIKSYLTPYALEYYSLLALETVFPPLLSEKLLICGYVLVFILGFRYLVGSVTAAPGLWTLAGAPFCLNAYVFLGFLNYALGCALALVLCGCWLRWRQDLSPRRLALLAGGFVLILLTHPVPALVFLVFAGLHMLVTFLHEWAGDTGSRQGLLHNWLRPAGFLAVMGAIAGAWVLRFTGGPHPGSAALTEPPETLLRLVTAELKFWTLAPLTGAIYRACLILVAASAAIALVTGLWKRRKWPGPAVSSLAGLGAMCLIASIAAPGTINGSAFFRERFSIYWVMCLIVVAAAVKPPRWCAVVLGVIALAATSAVVFFQWSYLSGTARELASAVDAPPVEPGSLGVVIADEIRSSYKGAVGDPFAWGSAHFFRTSKAILSNAPWTDLEIIMLRPRHVYPWTYCEPDRASRKTLESIAMASETRPDFAVRVDGDGPITSEIIGRLDFRAFRSYPQVAYYRPALSSEAGGAAAPAVAEQSDGRRVVGEHARAADAGGLPVTGRSHRQLNPGLQVAQSWPSQESSKISPFDLNALRVTPAYLPNTACYRTIGERRMTDPHWDGVTLMRYEMRGSGLCFTLPTMGSSVLSGGKQ